MTVTGINRAVLQTPTVHGDTIEPLPVNFFYGKNGTGKTTIAKALAEATNGIQWSEDLPNGADVFLYNRDTIDRIIMSSPSMPGVYTLSERNVSIQQEIEEKESLAEKMEHNIQNMKEELEKQQGWYEQDRENTLKMIWRTTSLIRKRYPEAIGDYGTDIEKFARRLLDFSPEASDLQALDFGYQMAYGDTKYDYDYIEVINKSLFPVCDMLDIPVANRSKAELSLFYSALGSMDWAKRGYDEYQHIAGCKCPYCGQDLPADFRIRFEKCLDQKYREAMKRLQEFRDHYYQAIKETERILAVNNQHPFVKGTDYPALSELLLERLKANLDIIDQKIQSPLKEFSLKDIDSVLGQLSSISDKINQRVRRRIQAANDLPHHRKWACRMVWNTMNSECKDLLVHLTDEEEHDKLRWLTLSIESNIGRHDQVLKEIRKLKDSTMDITPAMDAINYSLAANGFVGFHFEKKDDQHYAVVRDDGSAAVDLSDGERRVIAFMYYVYTVLNSTESNAEQKSKVVIIDDPVCSLDSEAMTYIAGMVRSLVDMCLSRYTTRNDDGKDSTILQIFCLTHNPVFFRYVSDSSIEDSKHCAFYRIRKGIDNVTTIERCQQSGGVAGGELINRSPVEDEYKMLWREYTEEQTPQDLLRTCRQILTHYFLYTCYYDAREMKRILMEENKESFTLPGCFDWQSSFNIISSMILLMSAETMGGMQGMYFDKSAMNCAQIRFVFEKIFEVMHQEQHFNHMIKMMS